MYYLILDSKNFGEQAIRQSICNYLYKLIFIIFCYVNQSKSFSKYFSARDTILSTRSHVQIIEKS